MMHTSNEPVDLSHLNTILVVDDNLANLEVLSHCLTSSGFQVMTARMGEAGLALVQREQPALVLLDVKMPGMDGFETCRCLKADETTREIPVIFMTVADRIEDKVKGLAVGGVDYIIKPFEAEEVVARCKTHLTLYQLQQDRKELNRTLEERVAVRTAELCQVNCAYRALRNCNQALLRATNESDLLEETCRIINDELSCPFVWIGFAEQDEAKTIRPVASVGYDPDYLNSLKLTWANTECGQGPSGTAIRTGQPIVNRDVSTIPSFVLWQEEATRRGITASAAFPMLNHENVLGVLNVYAAQADVFDAETVLLFMELASDLAYGITMLREQSERRRAEDQLRKLSRAVEQNATSIIITDTTGTIEYVNPKFTTLTGYSLEEVVGQNPRILKSGKTPPEEYTRLWQTITAGGEWRGEFWSKKKNGELYLETTSISPILNDAGEITHFVSVKEDITERRLAEQTARESQQWLSLLMAQSLLAVIECNVNLEIVAWNPAAEKVFGYTSKEASGQSAVSLLVPHPLQPEINQMMQILLAQGGGNHHVNENSTKDDRVIVCEWYNTSLVNEKGQIIGIALIGVDITERHEMEEARRDRDRLQAALEKEREFNTIRNNLMRTFSHEFRTPLAVISSASSVLNRYFERLTEEQRHKQLETIEQQVHKIDQMAEEIVSTVRGVFSEFTFRPSYTDLELLGQLAVTELNSTLGANHEMTYECEGQLQNVLVDERLVKRILVNLLSNAIKYSPEGSLIRLRITQGNETIIIQVSDQGIGIPAEDQKRLFEPFFRASNVETVSGIGLGLSIVRDCANLHQGIIIAESELDRGTTFTVRLPMHPTVITEMPIHE